MPAARIARLVGAEPAQQTARRLHRCVSGSCSSPTRSSSTPPSSVTGAQIKNDSITGKDVKDEDAQGRRRQGRLPEARRATSTRTPTLPLPPADPAAREGVHRTSSPDLPAGHLPGDVQRCSSVAAVAAVLCGSGWTRASVLTGRRVPTVELLPTVLLRATASAGRHVVIQFDRRRRGPCRHLCQCHVPTDNWRRRSPPADTLAAQVGDSQFDPCTGYTTAGDRCRRADPHARQPALSRR